MPALSSWFAGLLDLRCPNCGTRTASTLFWRCGKCGYPSRSKTVCPNCAQRTSRTHDGRCRWCGYPLKPGIYQEIPFDYSKTVEGVPVHSEEKPSVIPPAEQSPPDAETTKTIEKPVPSATEQPVVIEAPAPVNQETVATPHQQTSAQSPVTSAVSKAAPDEVIAVTVDELASEFAADPTRADEKYQDRLVKVKGLIELVTPAEGDRAPTVVLVSTGQAATIKTHCSIDMKYAGIIKRLTAGQRIAVLGRYGGYDSAIHLTESQPVG